ncbi:MAG: DMT family transporter [Pseudonocardiales bacterium]|nr:DMT family transporter [Pseudonocardiales bacterium]
MSFRLFADLIDKPVWLAGIVAMVSGQVLGALALGGGDGNVSLVEPLLTTNLLFALALARLLSAQQLAWREWGGALLLVAGVAAFIIAAQPGSGIGLLDQPRHWIFVGVIAAIVAATVSLARNTAGAARASLLATGAGLLFGMQDGFTRGAMLALDGGPLRLLESWLPYAVLAAAVVGLLLAQSAFEAAPLRVSLPAITAAEPLVGIAYGISVFGERVRTAPVWLTLEAAGLIAMIVGVVLLTRSPLLAPHRPGQHLRVPR